MQAAISGLVRLRQATGPEMSAPITPVVWLMITPGQAERMASTASAATRGSQLGRCPIPGDWQRKCTWMMEAPASKASRADCAICSGVTGTIGCCRGSVRTPFKAQVRMALDIGGLVQSCDLEEKRLHGDLRSGLRVHAHDAAPVDGAYPRFHLHGLDKRERLPSRHDLPRFGEDIKEKASHGRRDPRSISDMIGGVMLGFAKDKGEAAGAQMQVRAVPNRDRAPAHA